MCKELPQDPHSVEDLIPWLPLPHFVEEALLSAGRVLLRELFFRFLNEVKHGPSDIQPPDK